MRSILVTVALLIAALLFLILMPVPAYSREPGAVLIWPVNPVIDADKRAAALWLENPGKTPVTLQIRIYSWAQADGRNLYADTQEVAGTPPIVTIPPGEKQLIRLTRIGAVPAARETPYRIVIDEIPASEEAGTQGAAIAFRMRYSLPLFVEGGPARKSSSASPSAPELSWRIVSTPEGRFVEVRNRGDAHARLTEAAIGEGSARVILSDGLLGYVLPGQAMRWPLPGDARPSGPLIAAVNGLAAAPIAQAAD